MYIYVWNSESFILAVCHPSLPGVPDTTEEAHNFPSFLPPQYDAAQLVAWGEVYRWWTM